LLWVRLDGPSHNDKRLRLVEIVKAMVKDKKVRLGWGERPVLGAQEGRCVCAQERPPVLLLS
jgi:hypothetical protein